MVERIGILITLALAIAAGWAVVRLWSGWKLRRLRSATPLADLAPPGRPAVIAFSTPSCTECRTHQAPALSRLATALGDQVTVRSLSALDHPDLVQQMGILTVPATIVLDATGKVRHLNLGYASDTRLREQLAISQ
ncbi:MAG TPA: thioredoxin family protein [Roseiflexaceae bacterium]|nr:thioredoxin family protein [Roseiflexaceae bacterium]